ncbi:MAG TPA: hypothetical protein VJY47_03795 [Candidatus Dojkabacteria bacterium]|nr:hypothetical protein [Candidatus Dojkabacteria bacterium]
MKNKEYTKINLRDFRHNLTQLKDSLQAGMIYEVTEKGSPLAYFIPTQYDIQVKESKKGLSQESFIKALNMKGGNFNIPKDGNYKKEYRRLLEEEYLDK